MLTVFDYMMIRAAHAQGESIRSLARRLRHSQKTIRKALSSATGAPAPYCRNVAAACPKLTEAFKTVIAEILATDRTAPPKQRHTAMQIHRRLVQEHGYGGGYDQVRRHVQEHRRREQETFIPLSHLPGRRLECDFGHIHVDYPDGRKLVSVLVAAWSFSQAVFLIKLPNEKTESVLHGIVEALGFFGCCPRELWWDNPKTVAWMIHRGRERSLNVYYAALASHYRFEPLFCMPRKGQEKSDAERSVFALQRRFGTPVPQVRDDADLNAQLRSFSQAEMDRQVAGQTLTIGENFATDKAGALVLPPVPFDACVSRPAVVDKYQTVRVDGCRYSVPREYAFKPVTVRLYPERVAIACKDLRIAEHPRLWTQEASSLDPLHYVPALIRKPGALDHAGVFRTWNLPPSFESLRRQLEAVHGSKTGIRHYIRVLQLLTRHPVGRVEAALNACQSSRLLTAEVIIEKAQRLAAIAGSVTSPADLPLLPAVHVPPPDLRRFDQLLAGSPLPLTIEGRIS